MSGIGKDTVAILQFLLPGFLSAWIYYGLTPYTKPSEFERVIQALIFTLIVQAIVSLESLTLVGFGRYWTPIEWSTSVQLVASALTALAVGLMFSAGANNDFFHALARRIGISRETSYPSEWFGTLAKNVTYVVLQLNDERRLYGWPHEWPSDSREGHFALKDASWLTRDGEQPITGALLILISAKDVKWVEFMEQTWEDEA
ncbi:MAG: DUF6338 family protein [Rhizomicrobium sp.]